MALEQKLQVGDCIYDFKFPIAQGGGMPGFANQGVVDTSFKIKRVSETVKKRRILKDKIIVTVEHNELNFRWLPWVSGKINYADLGGKDVLSGMFTGCWMVLYKQGNFRVGHVATQTDDMDCKPFWRQHKVLPNVTDIKEFRPDIALPGALNLGLVTSTGDLYKIQLADEKEVLIENPWRTVEDWMDAEKGSQTDKSIAQFLAGKDEVSAQQIYGGFNYRILKLEGPLPAEVFPDK
jgi:hypothetical protein